MRGRELTDDERSRRDRAQGWTIIGALVGLAVLAGLWVGASSVLRSQVEVHSSRPECDGTRVVRKDLGDGFSGHERVPAMQLRPGMHCTVTVRVRNGGPVSVRVEEVVLPYMGPDGAAAARSRIMDGRRVRSLADPADDRTDARFARQDRIGPGGTVRFTLTYEFRPQGCDEGTTIWMRDQPRLFVSTLGHRGEVDGHSTIAFTSTAQSDSSPGCRAADQQQ